MYSNLKPGCLIKTKVNERSYVNSAVVDPTTGDIVSYDYFNHIPTGMSHKIKTGTIALVIDTTRISDMGNPIVDLLINDQLYEKLIHYKDYQGYPTWCDVI